MSDVMSCFVLQDVSRTAASMPDICCAFGFDASVQVKPSVWFWPGLANPGLAGLCLARLGLARPGLAKPGLARPGQAWRGMAKPGKAQAWPGQARPCSFRY